jgi:hypothetical protein
LVLVLAVASSSQAGDGKKGTKPEGTRGVITNVDTAAKTFTFRTGKKNDANAQEITVQFDDSTKFILQGENGPTDVKSDTLESKKHVSVVYESKAGKNVATKVTILVRKKKTS